MFLSTFTQQNINTNITMLAMYLKFALHQNINFFLIFRVQVQYLHPFFVRTLSRYILSFLIQIPRFTNIPEGRLSSNLKGGSAPEPRLLCRKEHKHAGEVGLRSNYLESLVPHVLFSLIFNNSLINNFMKYFILTEKRQKILKRLLFPLPFFKHVASVKASICNPSPSNKKRNHLKVDSNETRIRYVCPIRTCSKQYLCFTFTLKKGPSESLEHYIAMIRLALAITSIEFKWGIKTTLHFIYYSPILHQFIKRLLSSL